MDQCPHCGQHDMNLSERGYCVFCQAVVRPADAAAAPPPTPAPVPYPVPPPSAGHHRSGDVTIPAARLDEQSLQYLHDVGASSGQGFAGVYVARMSPSFAGPRSGWGFFLMIGLVLIGVLALLYAKVVPDAGRQPALPIAQALLAGFATLFLLLGITRFLRPKPRWPLRSFLFADGLYLWDANANRVVATPLPQLQRADGSHRFLDGRYASSQVVLTFPWGRRELGLADRERVELLVGFLQCLTAIRASPFVHTWANASPGRIGALADRLVRQGGNADLAGLPDVPEPPEPYAVKPGHGAPRPGWQGTLGRVGAAAAVAVAGFFVFPLVNTAVQDEHLFARAERESRERNAPGKLRAYLADPNNQRHRDEARRLIASYYDRAIAALKQKRDQDPNKIDRDLFAGVLALLEGLKQSDRPVVTVGFKATLDPEPKTAFQKESEKLAYDGYVQQNPGLKGVAERLPGGSAILTWGEAFNPEQTARREGVILGRLHAAVQQGIDADILTLEPAAAGQPPMMEVAYHIYASGRLGLYTDSGPGRPLKGLLRWYETDWTITIRPPGDQRAYVYGLHSEPGVNLTYDVRPGDPHWGAYAVVLYSGFYDLSARLIRNFGLDPGPAPNSFSFEAVARNNPNQPEVPQLPFPPPLDRPPGR